uniref:Uncharacterized protein n=1 Tax=Nicotiana tabacum TaxID=4097 RepID=A0A1S3Y1H0_TOBAC|nr:PREDICTED: uncharacterized protein LOC107771117 [Nicotiana tabacum]
MYLEIKQAHFYILQNCAESGSFIEKHLEILTKENNRNVAKRHKEKFPLWFQKKTIMMTNAHVFASVESAGVISNPQPRQMRKGRGKTRGFSIQKKRKNNPNGKLEVIIPPDRTVAVGPGANNFVTELLVTVDQNAKHDVKTWKKVSDLAKERIVDHMLVILFVYLKFIVFCS